jgi:hypothetical protein
MGAFAPRALAQQPGKIWRIGFIAHTHERFYDALFEGLRERGYLEGQNVIFERRYAEGRVERFKEFAAELVRLKADIISVVTTPAALAVKNATTTIPIVHPAAIDQVLTSACRPAIAYSRVGTGRTPSAVPSSNNFPASHLGLALGLIAQSCRAFSSPPLGPCAIARGGSGHPLLG